MTNNSVFTTIKALMDKGLTEKEAIKEWESKSRTPLPTEIKDRIKENVK